MPNASCSCGWPGDSLWDAGWGQMLKCFWLAFGPEQWSLIQFGIKSDWLQFGRCTHRHLVCACAWFFHIRWEYGWDISLSEQGFKKIIYRDLIKVPSQVWTLVRWWNQRFYPQGSSTYPFPSSSVFLLFTSSPCNYGVSFLWGLGYAPMVTWSPYALDSQGTILILDTFILYIQSNLLNV